MPIGESFNAEQREELLSQAVTRCEKIFTPDESLLCAAVQQKPMLNLLPSSVIVTNKRVIKYRPGMLKATFEDYLWRDMQEVHLAERLFGAELSFAFQHGSIVLQHLPKNQAKRIYSVAQQKEEEWSEKRRLRQLEEARAKSGASQISVGRESDGGRIGVKEKLLELKALLQDDLISHDEYVKKKVELLKDM